MAAVLLFAVALLSVLSNALIRAQFTGYVAAQQRAHAKALTEDIARQYRAGRWDLDGLHAIGMSALYKGYLICVDDADHAHIWSTEAHDSTACAAVMAEITARMRASVNGAFTSVETPLTLGGEPFGYAVVSAYGPYFLSEREFHFLGTLNRALWSVGAVSLVASLVLGALLARKLAAPVERAAAAAKHMAGGDYRARIEARTNARETDELIASINHLAEALEAQEALRRRLTSDVAHELRTPLTAVGTHLEAMIDGLWEATPERLESCQEELLRLGKLVGDIESLARVEGNPALDLETVELRALCEGALTSFRAALEAKGLRAAISGGPVEIPADADRLKQVLVNLLANAVQYARGQIEIEIWQSDSHAGFSVRDDGCGIAPEHLEHIFERFYRADSSRSRLSGGSGIGLAIARSIVEAHGGSVCAKSAPNEGSTFTASLPRLRS